MKILFGVQCTGNGHISRSREIVRQLKALGHRVLCVLSGRDPADLREMEVFEPYVVYGGLSFASSDGRIRPLRTLFRNNVLRMYRDVASFDARGFDLVVCDFEPITARIAKKRGIPSIGVGHQYAFAFDVPLVRSDPASRYILRHMASTEYPLGLHWHHFGFPILPPIVPPGMRRLPPVQNKILVYLPFEESAAIAGALRGIDSHEFYVYGRPHPAGDRGNLHWRSFSRAGFLEDLYDCDGVLCNAGFELPSEALHLGKRLLVKPLHGQLEQRSNALALVQLGFGTSMNELDPNAISDWLEHVPHIQPMRYPRTAEQMARWIDAGEWGSANELSRELWKNVPLDQGVRADTRERHQVGA